MIDGRLARRLAALSQQRGELARRAQAMRQQVAVDAAALAPPLAGIDRAIEVARYLGRHPLIAAALAAVVAGLSRQRIAGTGGAVLAWQIARRLLR